MKNIYLNGEIKADKTLANIKKQVGNDYAGGINLNINSPGGNVVEGDAIMDYLKSLDVPLMATLTSAASEAAKMAAQIPKLVLSPDAIKAAYVFMIHEAHVMPADLGKDKMRAEDFRAYADMLDTENDEMAKALMLKIELPYEKIRELMADETYMDANKVKQLKIAALNTNTMAENKTKPISNLAKARHYIMKALMPSDPDNDADNDTDNDTDMDAKAEFTGAGFPGTLKPANAAPNPKSTDAAPAAPDNKFADMLTQCLAELAAMKADIAEMKAGANPAVAKADEGDPEMKAKADLEEAKAKAEKAEEEAKTAKAKLQALQESIKQNSKDVIAEANSFRNKVQAANTPEKPLKKWQEQAIIEDNTAKTLKTIF